MRKALRSAVCFALAGVISVAIAQADPAVTAETERVFAAYSEHHDPSYYAEDATFTDMTNPTQPLVGREAIGGMLATYYGGGFSDGNYKDATWIASGNTVMNEFTFYGTHDGDLFGIPPTGRYVELHIMSVYRVEDGLIRWARLYYDSASLMRQLGLLE